MAEDTLGLKPFYKKSLRLKGAPWPCERRQVKVKKSEGKGDGVGDKGRGEAGHCRGGVVGRRGGGEEGRRSGRGRRRVWEGKRRGLVGGKEWRCGRGWVDVSLPHLIHSMRFLSRVQPTSSIWHSSDQDSFESNGKRPFGEESPARKRRSALCATY